jgi:hypothetical protein
MKDINDILNESLLDDEDEVFDNGINRAIAEQFRTLMKSNPNKSVDVLGRELHEGDLVVFKCIGMSAIGVIEKIEGGRCATSFGKRKNVISPKSGEIVVRERCCDMLKLTPEIAAQIMKLK